MQKLFAACRFFSLLLLLNACPLNRLCRSVDLSVDEADSLLLYTGWACISSIDSSLSLPSLCPAHPPFMERYQ